MEKFGEVTPRTPDIEKKLTKQAATGDRATKIKELDDDPAKRLSDKAAENLKK